jgi:LmbE family N-acetylglucosaminyl deacetylase/competence protein ComGC
MNTKFTYKVYFVVLAVISVLILLIPTMAVQANEPNEEETTTTMVTTSTTSTTIQPSSTTSSISSTKVTDTTGTTSTTKPVPFWYNVKVSGNSSKMKYMMDNSTSTIWDWSKNTVITVESNKKITIYIKWHTRPELWTLKANGLVVYKGGRNGFLHEFVPIDSHYSRVNLTLDMANGQIADFFVFDASAVPAWVQQWQPMLEKADMLVYAAHADDEHLWFGGTLPYYAGELKKKVQLAYMVRHSGTDIDVERNHELLDGAWTVGLRNYPMIPSFPDRYSSSINGALSIYKWNDILEYSVMLIRRFKPDVIIGHDANGEYGHGGHMLCSKALQEAVYISGNASKYPKSAEKYGIWNTHKCYLHLYKKNPISMNWDIPLKAFGGKTAIQVAQIGLNCHKTQIIRWPKVAAKGTRYDSSKYGLYYTAVGPDIKKNDFFENVVLGAIIKNPPTTLFTTTTTTTTAQITTTTTISTTIQTQTTIELSSVTDVAITQDKPLTQESSWIWVAVVIGCTLFISAGGVFLLLLRKGIKSSGTIPLDTEVEDVDIDLSQNQELTDDFKIMDEVKVADDVCDNDINGI